VSYESFRQTIRRTTLPPFEIKVKILAISVRIKGIGLQNVQIVIKARPVSQEIKVKIPVIIVKRKDIGLQSTLRNNRSRRRRRKRRKRCPRQRKNSETFGKRRKEGEKKGGRRRGLKKP
jgi:hypothetical protein